MAILSSPLWCFSLDLTEIQGQFSKEKDLLKTSILDSEPVAEFLRIMLKIKWILPLDEILNVEKSY